jgi:ATP-binding cassette subfamily C protein
MVEATEPRAGWRMLRAGLRGSGPSLRRLAAWSIVEALPALAVGWVTARAIDRGFVAGRPAVGAAWLLSLGGLYVLRAFAQRASLLHLANVVEPMRDRFAHRTVEATLSRAAAAERGVDAAAVSRLTRQLESARQLVAALLRVARPLGFTVIAAVVGLSTLSPILAVLVLPPLTLALLLLPVSLHGQFRRSRAVILADEQVAADTAAVLYAARDIAALGAEDTGTATVARSAQRSARATMAAVRAGQARHLVVLLGGQVPILVLLVAAPGLLAGGRITTGEMIGAITTLVSQLLPALQTATGATSAYLAQLRSTLGRLAETASRTEQPPPATSADRPHGRGDLTVTGLTFGYGVAAEPVLRSLSLTVPHGQHLAVVGASGIGKSTLAALLAGVHRPGHGEVRYGKTQLAGLPPATRARLVTLVPQEAYVFAGTVRANASYLRPTATDDELRRATREVGAEHLVERLGGWSSELHNPSAELSAGERQLLVLVRAYLCAAPVIILDEATCHLDPVAEARAEHAFADRPDTTLIVVAHRIASAQRADRILLLDGTTVHLGTHGELLTTSPAYAAMTGFWSVSEATSAQHQ